MSSKSDRGLKSVPLRGRLSAKYQDTFAYPTIKDRCPIILCKIIDHLYRERVHIGEHYGKNAQEELKNIIEKLSKLRYEMQTNKPLSNLSDGRESCQVWNDYLEKERGLGEGITWYSGAWMWVECYMYRRIFEAVSMCQPLRELDFFRQQKEEGFRDSLPSMEILATWLLAHLPNHSEEERSLNISTYEEMLTSLIQIALWGNKCDLSISAGSKKSAAGNTIDQLKSLKAHILVNDTQNALQVLEDWNQIVDIVMDNAGYEWFTDLCLADYLISCKKATKVRFRVKNQPWFVSDTTPQDFDWSLNNLLDENKPSLFELGKRWKNYRESGVWSVHVDNFWTYPHVYSELKEADPQLYAALSEAKLVIFKGDLNYRKLVGDLNWEATVDFKSALQGFSPTNVLSLRTLKADVVTGLQNGQAENLDNLDKDWMINGNWGVIQFALR